MESITIIINYKSLKNLILVIIMDYNCQKIIIIIRYNQLFTPKLGCGLELNIFKTKISIKSTKTSLYKNKRIQSNEVQKNAFYLSASKFQDFHLKNKEQTKISKTYIRVFSTFITFFTLKNGQSTNKSVMWQQSNNFCAETT